MDRAERQETWNRFVQMDDVELEVIAKDETVDAEVRELAAEVLFVSYMADQAAKQSQQDL